MWEEAWQRGDTPWDAGKPAPALETLLAGGDLPKGRALVPGCGSGYDVFALAQAGYQVTGIDVATALAPRFETLRRQSGVDPERAQLLQLDFFTYAPPQPFDLVWDYTFLCAIDRARRPEWAAAMRRLVAEGGELVTLLFPVDPKRPREQGPPFALEPDEVAELLRPHFRPLHLAPTTDSHPARQGREWIGRWAPQS
mgnify:CR=1 FL=1